MNEILISFIIPVFNNFAFTQACITDLLKLKNNIEIIVVDNASTDETINLKKYFGDKISIIKNNTNLGFAKACNIGFAQSKGDFVIFLNNDIRVKSNFENWVNNLIIKDALVSPNGGLIDYNCSFIKETNQKADGYFYLSGWCLAGFKNIFNKLKIKNYIGPFSEEFGLAYFEDTDLSFRAAKQLIPLKVVNIPVHHFGKMTSVKVGTSALYHNAKNIFSKKWINKMPWSKSHD